MKASTMLAGGTAAGDFPGLMVRKPAGIRIGGVESLGPEFKLSGSS